ncbi:MULTISPECIES: aminoacyl-histidine dipeptidase [Mannheimia]|uniref:Cytosol non-specific dipeptidase n=1 Tax=Mannheimia pernigra TaxID=111844 RepID=A0A7H8V0N4_9PAST|nr:MULTISPECIES: aminoacyl-histidine dipeptidase [Mannheimia]QLB41197.1 aminoacyl-histidine dipeptidase [Mannheimia pernigra]QLB45211.1 aminoacyl-histidine dipeptidase [Mannheimia pernigra]QTM01460.1 beta-Ala-His dipeptidase [Mannheimia sp. ZY171111]
MSEISTLAPQLLWQWFDKVCAIPHPSYHEEELAEFIVNWAKSKTFFVERDEAGNVLIRKPATVGMENRATIALQAHLDMVPQANAGTVHDFKKDPIQPYIDGDWVKAKGTTLGADNGIGLASCLAVLDSDDLAHPTIEVLLTMTEEAGMEGAIGLRPNWLTADMMINTDTEENGEIYIGCAGGENVNITLPVFLVPHQQDSALTVTLKGLQGGHSGCDIHTNRANAIKVFAHILEAAYHEVAFQISAIQGGSVRNAIPREAQATLIVSAKNKEKLTACLTQTAEQLKAELNIAEPNLQCLIEEANIPAQAFDLASTERVIHFLNILPNGVVRNSDVVKNVVETSLSVGVLTTEESNINVTILARSLIEGGKAEIRSKIRSLATLVGAEADFSGNYPGWEPNPNSKITPLTKAIYDDILGYESEIKVIHAGLECGLINKIYPNMDFVSIGPTILNAHSPDEKVHIPAVEIYWKLLTRLLAQAPAK